jgi:hypothetical protein
LARPTSRLRMGYFPLPEAEARRIRQHVVFRASSFTALDPCAGEGNALRHYGGDLHTEMEFLLLVAGTSQGPGQANCSSGISRSGRCASVLLASDVSGELPPLVSSVVAIAKEAFPEIESIAVPITQTGATFVSMSQKGFMTLFQSSKLLIGK